MILKNKNREAFINGILEKMTLEEKIGQITQYYSPEPNDSKALDGIKKGSFGSFIMATSAYAGNEKMRLDGIKHINELQRIAVEESRLGIPLLFGRDVIHGHNTVLPIPLGTAASFNDDLVKECYSDIALEARLEGVNWTFAPVIDISRDPRWGRCVEGAGEDPYLSGRMAQAIVNGFQNNGKANIAACAKHYIGYGAAEGGRDYHKTEITDNTLRNYYLPPFKAAVKAGVATVMNSFNEIGGQPVAASRYLLKDILKGETGFARFIISDWGAIEQLIKQGIAEDRNVAAKIAFNAGIDMDMVDNCYKENLEQLIKNGQVQEADLNESVRRILRVKFDLGLFEDPYAPQHNVNMSLHKRNACRLAAESMVLLKNKNSVLPLSKKTKAALVGPMTDEKETMLGTWCLDGIKENVVSIRDGFEAAIGGERIVAKEDADVIVLCLGEDRNLTGEANSIANIEIEPSQLEIAEEVAKLGKPVVALLAFGRPRAIEKLEPLVDAMIYMWHPGTQAGNAVCNILFGDENPSGRLPMTMPRSTGQIPIYYNATPSGRDVNGYYYSEEAKGAFGIGLTESYRDVLSSPMYRFGFGLSYSEFELSGFHSDKEKISKSEILKGGAFNISLNVKNCSAKHGKDVIQLYVRDKTASVTRPLRELKGYEKLFLNSFEEKEINFKLGFEELAFYNFEKKFDVEKGEFDIFIGHDCYADKVLTIEIV